MPVPPGGRSAARGTVAGAGVRLDDERAPTPASCHATSNLRRAGIRAGRDAVTPD